MHKIRTVRGIAAAGAAALAMLVASPSFAANAKNGGELAKQWCASCHVVSADQKMATAGPPPFASIAKRPGFNAKAVAFFLLNPHPPMPNFSLTRSEANDLAAYIASLK